MALTEKEARAKWCPMAMVAIEQAAANRLPRVVVSPDGETEEDTSANCIASHCMAWTPSPIAGNGSCGLVRG